MDLMKFGVLIVAFIALVHAQSQFHLTPNIVEVEQVISSGQTLCGLTALRNAIGILHPFTFEVEQTSEQASNGLRRQKLNILYDGVLVRVVKLQASIDENGCYTGAVSGYYPSNFPAYFDVTPSKTVAELRSTIVNYMDANDEYPCFVPGITDDLLQNFTYEKQIEIDILTGIPTLVYYVTGLVDVTSDIGAYIRYPRALIRVSDLSIVKIDLIVLKESSTRTGCPKALGGNDKFPGNVYGPGRHKICLNAEKRRGICTYKNDQVEIWDVSNSFDRSTAELVSFQCSQGPDDAINGAESPSSDTFYFSQVFYDMLHAWGKVNNTRTEPLRIYVHFGNAYPNSFFDGQAVTLGDGSHLTYPIAVQEIIGHELGHILTDGFNNLQLNMETVALNEAFSDICGKAVSLYLGENGWTFAKRFARHEVALRYFDNPPLDGLGIDHLNDFDLTKGVYSIMGLITKFFYNVVEIEAVSYRDAFQTMVLANQLYWNEESSIIDGACGVLRAASDLGLDITAFEDAFGDVGIDLTFCSLSGTLDVIACAAQNSVVTRHPLVSSSRNPKYLIEACPGTSTVSVSVTCGGSVSIFTEINGVIVNHNSDHIVINIGSNDVYVGVTSNDSEIIPVELEMICH